MRRNGWIALLTVALVASAVTACGRYGPPDPYPPDPIEADDEDERR